MSHYHHLSIEERESIWEAQLKGVTIVRIAAQLGRSKGTISRELKRNGGGKYRPSVAQGRYEQRRRRSVRKRLLAEPELRTKVLELLTQQQWSPEQISNRLRYEHNGTISYNTIYRALKAGTLEPQRARKTKHGRYPLQQHLRRKGKNYVGKKPRGMGFVHQSIDDRPTAADTRSQFGHWEGDLVYSSYHKRYIVTLVDRRSRFLLTTTCGNKEPEGVAMALITLLKGLEHSRLRSITLDRGLEFRHHDSVTQAIPNADFYFAHPGCPWERGLNENTNGLLRQYVPKRSYKTPFSDALLDLFTFKLNHRPRKSLNWKSPFEVFFHKSLHLT